MKSDREELIQKDLETNRKWKLRKRDNPKSPLKFRVWVTAIFPCHGFASAQSRESQDYIQVLQPQETVLLHHLLSGSLTEEPVWWTSLPRHIFTIAFFAFSIFHNPTLWKQAVSTLPRPPKEKSVLRSPITVINLDNVCWRSNRDWVLLDELESAVLKLDHSSFKLRENFQGAWSGGEGGLAELWNFISPEMLKVPQGTLHITLASSNSAGEQGWEPWREIEHCFVFHKTQRKNNSLLRQSSRAQSFGTDVNWTWGQRLIPQTWSQNLIFFICKM